MLKSYAFDVDANLVFTDDTIWIEVLENGNRTPREISQKQFEELWSDINLWKKLRYVNNDKEQSMVNFKRKWGFEKSVFDALSQGKLGPSWNKFLEANKQASPIALITARGHPIEDLKSTHKKIIYEVLTEGQREDLIDNMKEHLWRYYIYDDMTINAYLDNNYYAPCTNEVFLESINKNLSCSMPETKNAAFEQFVLHVKKVFESYYGANFLTNRKIRLGFSDDTNANIQWLDDFINKEYTWLMWKYNEIKFALYDTNKPENTIKFNYSKKG